MPGQPKDYTASRGYSGMTSLHAGSTEEVDFRATRPDDLVSTYLRQGCVLLRNFVDAAALARVYDITMKAYEHVDKFHVYPDQLRELGLPVYSDVLFSQPHYDVLDNLFGGHDYEIAEDTVSRRMASVREPPHWMEPLGPHLDAFLNAPQFAVNFWIPFQECGVDAPSLGVVHAPFAEILSFTGYQGGADVWVDPEPLGRFQFTQFRPEMKAMCRGRGPEAAAEMRERFRGRIRTPSFEPGDAMMLSNWTLHFTHATPAMTKRRENLELRFRSPASLDDILREHGIAGA